MASKSRPKRPMRVASLATPRASFSSPMSWRRESRSPLRPEHFEGGRLLAARCSRIKVKHDRGEVLFLAAALAPSAITSPINGASRGHSGGHFCTEVRERPAMADRTSFYRCFCRGPLPRHGAGKETAYRATVPFFFRVQRTLHRVAV